eukprot:661949-Pyramimonas_sp.AAC.1
MVRSWVLAAWSLYLLIRRIGGVEHSPRSQGTVLARPPVPAPAASAGVTATPPPPPPPAGRGQRWKAP